MRSKIPKPPRMAKCHPDRRYYSRDLCVLCYMREFKRTNPANREYMKAYLKRYNAEHKEQDSARKKADRKDPIKKKRYSIMARRSVLKIKFGMSELQYLAMFEDQNFKCAICKIYISPDKAKSTAIDHDHVTGIVRGLLCIKCNSGIGFLGDSLEVVLAAAAYLNKAAAKTAIIADQASTNNK